MITALMKKQITTAGTMNSRYSPEELSSALTEETESSSSADLKSIYRLDTNDASCYPYFVVYEIMWYLIILCN